MGRAAKKPAGPYARALSAEVRAELARRNTSRAWLEAAAGMSKTYLGDRLRDSVAFDLDDIAAISAAFGITPKELMDRAIAQMEGSTRRPGDTGETSADPRGPILAGEPSFTGAQSEKDDEMLRQARAARRRSKA